MNAESGAERGLHASPEARLWLTVMLRAAASLKDSTGWLSRSLETQGTQFRDSERVTGRGHTGPLAKQVAMHLRRVRDAEQFFFGIGSSFGEICELLGYNEAAYRSRVAVWLGGCAEVLRKAETFVEASGIRRPAGRHREPRQGTRWDRSAAVRRRSPLASRASPGWGEEN